MRTSRRRGSLDPAAPKSQINSPAPGSILPVGVATTIAGTAFDFGGGSVSRVEVSFDGGATWRRAQGTHHWTFEWTPSNAGSFNLMSRARDDSGNVEVPLSALVVTTTAALRSSRFSTTTLYVPQISLGSAHSFGVLGSSTVTNTGATTIVGDLGVSPGTAVTAFPPGVVVGGAIHGGDATAAQAQTDVTTAYNNIAGRACTLDLTGQDLGGRTLTPGVYCFSAAAGLTGTLTLDFQSDPSSVFLFKTGSTLTTASASSVVLANNGGTTCPPNVYWLVGSSATLGTGAKLLGNILALASITLTTGAKVDGRALARNGAVTMDTNIVTACDFSTITSLEASGSGVYPPGTTYGAVPISAVEFSSGVEVGPTGTALGQLTVTLIGTGIGGVERDILVEAEANAGSRPQPNVTIFSGTATIDMGDGTPPLPGIPFSATITSDGSGLGTLALALGATTLPVATIDDGTIVLGYR